MTALLTVSGIGKRYPRSDRAALEQVSFEVRDGELLTLVGASGSGKTTLLRIVAGLETADTGEVRLRDEVLTAGRDILRPPEGRQVGLVFQHHALFPHLTVGDNVGFGLNRTANRAQQVTDLLSRVRLQDLAERYPHELSGGERQRIALVRALAAGPSLLLLDEPFSSLDPSLREALREETRHLLKQQGITAILVTHDIRDALAVSDRIVVLHEGAVQQTGTPTEIYRQPASRRIAESVGPCNFLDRGDFDDTGGLDACRGIEPDTLSATETWIRPEDLALAEHGAPGALATGEVVEDLYHGDSRLVRLRCAGAQERSFTVQVRVRGDVASNPGERHAVVPVRQRSDAEPAPSAGPGKP